MSQGLTVQGSYNPFTDSLFFPFQPVFSRLRYDAWEINMCEIHDSKSRSKEFWCKPSEPYTKKAGKKPGQHHHKWHCKKLATMITGVFWHYRCAAWSSQSIYYIFALEHRTTEYIAWEASENDRCAYLSFI